jgi:hypothetical protein
VCVCVRARMRACMHACLLACIHAIKNKLKTGCTHILREEVLAPGD